MCVSIGARHYSASTESDGGVPSESCSTDRETETGYER